MDQVGDDADAALTWEALQGVGSDDEAVNAFTVGIRTPHVNGVGVGAVHGALDADDHEAFTPLVELPSFAEPNVEHATSTTIDGTGTDQAPTEEGPKQRAARPLSSATSVRSKRQNFSKHLQFLCLERYADHTRVYGKLPDRSECQLMLHHGYCQFTREGGSAAHPRLTYGDFLKLIRNRSAERQRRLRRSSQSEQAPRRWTVSCGASIVRATSSNEGRSSGKRKRIDEYEAKIDQLIEEIDRVRRRPAADPGGEPVETPHSQAPYAVTATLSQFDTCQSMVEAILQLQQKTIRLQQDMQERLTSLREQCRHHQEEPSSASV